MSDKRRLSSNSSVLGLTIEDDDFDLDLPGGKTDRRKSSSSRGSRRASFGSALTSARNAKTSVQEQNKIADMYKMVIKLSSENKINAKNSWNLELIEHMGQIIRDESKKEINFQKASCTLDASVKIYSYRVDDTWSSSLRILDNLSRGGNGETQWENDEENEETEVIEDGEGNVVKKSGKVGGKSLSFRHGLSNTIEKNVANLNLTKIDGESVADPMFQKMSLAFDEGGAKGMLMNNMRVAAGTSSLMFGEALPVEKTCGPSVNNAILRDLVNRLNILPHTLNDTKMCPILEEYRGILGISPVEAGDLIASPEVTSLPQPIALPSQPVYISAQSNSESVVRSVDEECAFAPFDDGDDDDLDGGFQVDSNDDTVAAEAQPGPTGKIAWANIFQDDEAIVEKQATLEDTESAAGVAWSQTGLTQASEYTFFDAAALSACTDNKWAGSKHWKFAVRSSKRATKPVSDGQSKSTENLAGDDNGELVQASRKANVAIDFSDTTPLDASLFAISSKKKGAKATEGNVLSNITLQKQLNEAKDGALLLPEDSKIQINDMCRLFLRPNMIAPPAFMLPYLQKTEAKSSITSFLNKDVIWGVASSSGAQTGVAAIDATAVDLDAFNENTHYMTESGDILRVNDDDNDDSPAAQWEDENTESIVRDLTTSLSTGLAINTANLLQASRKVEKVNVGYATSAKLVNVKKLKTDIWTFMESSLIEGGSSVKVLGTAEGLSPLKKRVKPEKENAENLRNGVFEMSSQLSFQNVVHHVATTPAMRQKDASLSFYFISLLHLANEKGLSIVGNNKLDDLVISKPTVSA